MKIIISVSKKHKSVWKIYYYELDDDDNWLFRSKRISKWLVPYYKLCKVHRTKMYCTECFRAFTEYSKSKNPKDVECPYCEVILASN